MTAVVTWGRELLLALGIPTWLRFLLEIGLVLALAGLALVAAWIALCACLAGAKVLARSLWGVSRNAGLWLLSWPYGQVSRWFALLDLQLDLFWNRRMEKLRGETDARRTSLAQEKARKDAEAEFALEEAHASEKERRFHELSLESRHRLAQSFGQAEVERGKVFGVLLDEATLDELRRYHRMDDRGLEFDGYVSSLLSNIASTMTFTGEIRSILEGSRRR